ncbi:MAG: hypothetical protein ACRC9X_08115 [Bacteroidales bacterium]
MKVSDNYFDHIFDFKGLWDMPSKCGLKLFKDKGKTVILVTELYQDNPGSSITCVARSLMEQICAEFEIAPDKAIYIECAPDMNSKLSFYDQKFFLVDFTEEQPKYTKIDDFQTFLMKYE